MFTVLSMLACILSKFSHCFISSFAPLCCDPLSGVMVTVVGMGCGLPLSAHKAYHGLDASLGRSTNTHKQENISFQSKLKQETTMTKINQVNKTIWTAETMTSTHNDGDPHSLCPHECTLRLSVSRRHPTYLVHNKTQACKGSFTN